MSRKSRETFKNKEEVMTPVIVFLSVLAWKSGWRRWAIAPSLAGLWLCFSVGFFEGVSANDCVDMALLGPWIEMAILAVLGWLIYKPRPGTVVKSWSSSS